MSTILSQYMYYVRVCVSVGGKVTARPSFDEDEGRGWDACADRRDETVRFFPTLYLPKAKTRWRPM
ncbi:MAG: hypothetical protein GY820_06195 [Gammaproteobacteria bacterium]|nr:hypothetical protein [Gammaproteobacteria bacterium]